MAKLKNPTPQDLYRAKRQREEEEKSAYLPPGLHNHGNTCFMNSVLQGLIATHLLADLTQFHPISHSTEQHSSPSLDSRRSPLLTNGRKQGDSLEQPWVNTMPIGDMLLGLMLRAWQSQSQRERKPLSPKPLLSALGKKYEQYLDFAQQDAHEFLRILLDATRMEELDIIKKRQPPPINAKQRRRTTITPSSRHPEVEPEIPEDCKLMSLADMVFGGKLTSFLVCQKCNHVSQTYEDFNDISLSIKMEDYRERKRDRFRNFAKRLTGSLAPDQPRSSSVPPEKDSRPPVGESEPLVVVDPRRRSLDIVAEPGSEQGITSSEDSVTMSSVADPPLAIANEVFGETGKHIERSHSALRSDRKEKDNWTKIGKRLSMLGKTSAVIIPKNSPSEAIQSLPPAIVLSRPSSPSPQMNGDNHEGTSSSQAPSPFPPFVPSRQLSQSQGPKPLRLPKASPAEIEYLRAVLADTTRGSSNHHFPLFKPHHPLQTDSHAPNNLWLSMSHFSGLEECLRIFTSVEILNGENMVGCRRCWKIANGVYTSQSPQEGEDGDEDDDSDDVDPSSTEAQPFIPSNNLGTSELPLAQISTSISTPTVGFYLHTNSSDRRSISSLPEVSPSSVPEIDLVSNPKAVVSSISSPIPPNLARSHLEQPPNFTASAPPSIDQSTSSYTAPRNSNTQIISPIPQLDPVAQHLLPPHLTDVLPIPKARPSQLRVELETDESSAESEAPSTYSLESASSTLAHPQDNSPHPLRSISHSAPFRKPTRPKPVIMRPAYKRYLIGTPPSVLVIHLKRFQQLSKNSLISFSHGFKKLDNYVTFPEFLDLTPYLAPKKEDFGLGKRKKFKQASDKLFSKGEKEKCMYRLYAVVVHIGNMLGGHYIAYTALSDPSLADTSSDEKHDTSPKRPRQWAYISDTVVRLTTLEEVLKAKAYICMYERI